MAGFTGEIFDSLVPVLFGGHGFTVADSTPPVVTLVSTPTVATGAYIVQVYDDDPGLRMIELWAQLGSDPRGLMLHDGTSFWYPFDLRSTRTGEGSAEDPYEYTVYAAGGWPEGQEVAIYVRGVDTVGNMVEV